MKRGILPDHVEFIPQTKDGSIFKNKSQQLISVGIKEGDVQQRLETIKFLFISLMFKTL